MSRPRSRGTRHQTHESRQGVVKAAKRASRDRNPTALLQEVQIYQAQLAAQNDALLRAQAELEETRDQFVALYDFAPSGYLTLDEGGVITRINLTGAALLGRARERLEGLPLLAFVTRAHRAKMLEFLRRCRSSTVSSGESVDLVVQTFDGPREVELLCRPRHVPERKRREFFTAIIDLTERRELEQARKEASEERSVLARRLIETQESERKRIARDLHDNVGQQITAMRLRLSALSAREQLDADSRAELLAAQDAMVELDRTIDFMSSELRPTSLDLGFLSAIRQFVRQWSTTFGIHTDFETDGLDSIRLHPDLETHVYRVVQEALHNVYKHAAVNSARVTLVHDRAALVVTIQDGGKGFSTRSREPDHSGMGLVSMRERADIIGGTLQVISSPGKGTSVSLRVPDAIGDRGDIGTGRRNAKAAGSRRPTVRAAGTASASPAGARAAKRQDQSRSRRTPTSTRNSFSPLSPSSPLSRKTRR